MKKYAWLFAVLGLVGCAWLQENKDTIKTVLDIARMACEMQAGQTGLNAKDVCATEKQLRPYTDAILAGQSAAAAARSTEGCPKAPTGEVQATAPSAAPVASVSAPAPAAVPSEVPAPAVSAEPAKAPATTKKK